MDEMQHQGTTARSLFGEADLVSRLVADYSLQPPPTPWCCTGMFVFACLRLRRFVMLCSYMVHDIVHVFSSETKTRPASKAI